MRPAIWQDVYVIVFTVVLLITAYAMGHKDGRLLVDVANQTTADAINESRRWHHLYLECSARKMVTR